MTTVAGIERRLTLLLAGQAALSIVGGAAGAVVGRRLGDEELRHFGQQTVAWGLVDAAIAAAGMRTRDRPDEKKRAQRLRKLLWVNAGLDVGYISVGLAWRRRGTASARGNGHAVIVQGAHLLVLDVAHALELHRKLSDATAVSDS